MRDDSRSTNAKPHRNRGASPGRHIAWLHFVASPQRVPVFGYRLRGRTVMNVIYRLPPFSSNAAASVRSRGGQRRRASGCVALSPDCATVVVSTNTDHAFYVFKLRRTRKSFKPPIARGAGDPAPRRSRHSTDRISGLCPNGPAMVSMVPKARGIVPRVDVATAPRSRFRHR
jgi:hypothetical protein